MVAFIFVARDKIKIMLIMIAVLERTRSYATASDIMTARSSATLLARLGASRLLRLQSTQPVGVDRRQRHCGAAGPAATNV